MVLATKNWLTSAAKAAMIPGRSTARLKSRPIKARLCRSLLGEDAARVAEGFELEGVTGRVEQHHGALLADLALETHVRLHDKRNVSRAQTMRELFPFIERKDDAEVRDGQIVVVDDVVLLRGAVSARAEMSDDLMTEEVEADEHIGTAAFRTAEHAAIEGAGLREVIDGEGYVEGREVLVHGGSSRVMVARNKYRGPSLRSG